jgi:preprotein translocase subunit SecD
MQFLQAVLSTGALPMKLSIAEVSDVSAKLGGDFRREALLTGALALAMVAAIVFARYRDPALTAAIVTTSSAEIVLILGMASLIRWQIDLAAIAGLIAAVGTGVDSQIIIADTVLSGGSGEGRRVFGWRARISQAFFIIFAAAGTTCSGMLPLTFVGLGSVKGFAITTILGVLIGVLVSRPSFIRILENST